jgi:hypothetical protein
MIDIFHTIRKMDDKMTMIIDKSFSDMIFIEPGREFFHEVVQAAGFHNIPPIKYG